MAPRRPALHLRDGFGLAVLVGVLVLALLGIARPVDPLPVLTAARADGVAARIAAREPAQRAEAKKQFPFDLWSQDDAFQVKEQAVVRAEAKRAGVGASSVLEALDAYQRANPSAMRKNGVSPCKPRPFYD